MPVASVQDPTFRVEFDLAVLAEDSDHSTPKGRAVMRDAIRELDRGGISASRLKAKLGPPLGFGSSGTFNRLRIDRDRSVSPTRHVR